MYTSEFFTSLTTGIIDAMILTVFFRSFSQAIRSTSRILFITTTVIILRIIAFAFLSKHFKVIYLSLFFYIIMIFCISFLYLIPLSKKVLISVFYIVATIISEAIAMLILTTTDYSEENYLINGAITTIVIKLTFVLIWIFSKKYLMKDNTYVELLLPKSITVFVLIIPVTSLIFLSFFLYNFLFCENLPTHFLLQTVFFVIIVNLIMFVAFISISNYYSEVLRDISYQHFLKEENKYWKTIDSRRESLRIQIHDLKNVYTVVLGMIQSGNIQEAKDYLHEKIELTDSLKPVFYSSNPILNNFLSYKFSNIKKHGISVKVKVFVDNSEGIDNDTLANILGNLIDNSINACKKNASDKREIELFIKYFNQTLLIKMVNPISEAYKFFEPGTGLKSISILVNQYGGIFENSVEDGKYKTTIVIWDNEKEG